MGFNAGERSVYKEIEKTINMINDVGSRHFPTSPLVYRDGIQRGLDGGEFDIWCGSSEDLALRRIEFESFVYNGVPFVYGWFQEVEDLERYAHLFRGARDMGVRVKIRTRNAESNNRVLKELKEDGLVEEYDLDSPGFIILFGERCMVTKKPNGDVIVSINRQKGKDDTKEVTEKVKAFFERK